MKLESPANRNYCAVVVTLERFADLANCNNVKAAIVFGNSVIVAKSAAAGDIGLFFPVETALSKEFLGANNLYRKSEWGNVDPEKKGYFEEHGRIRAVKFRGHKSDGFWIPIDSIAWALPSVSDLTNFRDGMEFDKLNGHEICRKYVPKINPVSQIRHGKQARQAKAEDRIVDGQFRFHFDTENLRRNIDKISPGMLISISTKVHGTSAVYANVLVKRNLNWFDRLLKWAGVKIQDREYGFVWSSRKVVKGVDGESKAGAVHYYDSDIWGVVGKEVEPLIPKGYTVYGEIIGYTPEGAMIQKGYHYGCEAGTHKLLVYRVTVTNEDGKVVELSWPQMREFCGKYGFLMVEELYYGKAGNFGSWDLSCVSLADVGQWRSGFLEALEVEFVHDQMCPLNNCEVPAEGIVVRVDHLDSAESWKLKSHKFLEWETSMIDKGEADIEEQQTAEGDAF